jgi:hypothetical protein
MTDKQLSAKTTRGATGVVLGQFTTESWRKRLNRTAAVDVGAVKGGKFLGQSVKLDVPTKVEQLHLHCPESAEIDYTPQPNFELMGDSCT